MSVLYGGGESGRPDGVVAPSKKRLRGTSAPQRREPRKGKNGCRKGKIGDRGARAVPVVGVRGLTWTAASCVAASPGRRIENWLVVAGTVAGKGVDLRTEVERGLRLQAARLVVREVGECQGNRVIPQLRPGASLTLSVKANGSPKRDPTPLL